jgi:uncharacterized protein YbbC (DUF1343 family)
MLPLTSPIRNGGFSRPTRAVRNGGFSPKKLLGSSAPCAFLLVFLIQLTAQAKVEPGVEVWMGQHFGALRGKKIGLVTNQTGVLSDLRHEADVLAASKEIQLVALFAPEHGFRGASQAGHAESPELDEATHLPVFDTYGKSGVALADLFRKSGAEAFVFDLQDAGARYYTFIWTLYDAMEAAATLKRPFVVLDRPNPIGGVAVQGPVLEPGQASFIGRKPIALRHGMTIGELARFYNAEFLGGAVDLTVIPMRGWSRAMSYEDTGLRWIPPSPNMPTVDTAYAFCGTGLFEGTNLSEGRGTTRPFETIGGPGIDRRFAAALHLPGVVFRETWFRPTFDKWHDETIGGVQLHVTDRRVFDPVRTAVAMLVAAKHLDPQFAWRRDWIDKMWGSDRLRTAIDAGKTADEIVAGYRDELARFVAARKKYLLYK